MPTRALKASRRVLLLAAAALLALAASTALAQGGGEVRIQPPDGSAPVTVSLDDVEGTIDGAYYEVRDSRGDTRRVQVFGASLDEVLRAAGYGRGYTYVHLERGTVGTIRLSRTQITTGALPPAVYVEQDGTVRFIRALTGPRDENASDWLAVDGPLVVRQTVDTTLRVKVTASERKVEQGDSVSFEAEVRGGGVGDSYEIAWRFGDGGKAARGRRVERSFDEPGRYRVQATARTPDDIARGAVTIEVGEAEDGGPDREGGGTNSAGDAPATGAYDGYDGGGGAYDSTADDYSYDAAPDYSTPDYTPVEPDMTPPARAGGPTVEGNVLSDVAAAPAASAADVAARTGNPVAGPVDPAGVPTAAWALGSAIALLGAGAGMESGGARGLRRRPRLPRLLRR